MANNCMLHITHKAVRGGGGNRYCSNKLTHVLVVVQDFYYNATPKAPPKREYGEATRTLTPPHSRIIPLSPLRDVTTVK